MAVLQTTIPMRIYDAPTLDFIDHCLEHWDDENMCSRVHVRFMHYLVRFIFNLPVGLPLNGVRFSDNTLAMVSPHNGRVFFALTKGESWRAVHVAITGQMMPRWSVDVGFYEGLESCTIFQNENVGPSEDVI